MNGSTHTKLLAIFSRILCRPEEWEYWQKKETELSIKMMMGKGCPKINKYGQPIKGE